METRLAFSNRAVSLFTTVISNKFCIISNKGTFQVVLIIRLQEYRIFVEFPFNYSLLWLTQVSNLHKVTGVQKAKPGLEILLDHWIDWGKGGTGKLRINH